MENNYFKVLQNYTGSHSLVELNLDELIKTQSNIVLKYEPVEDLLFPHLLSKGFITMFDKYLFHCVEEVIECREELNKSHVSTETINEVIDILLYLGSMNYIINLNLSFYDMKYKSELNIDATTFQCTNLTVDKYLMDVTEYLVSQRRYFPQRKWHKPSREFSEIQFKHILLQMYELNNKAIVTTSELLLCMTNLNVNYANELINTKQQFVIDLPMPTK